LLPIKPSHYSPRMEALAWLVVVLAGYLPGSLPAGLLAGRLKGVDIRAVGSGNIGATNAFRVLGKGIGVAVLLVDVMKGLLPCLFLPALVAGVFPESQAPELQTLHMLIGVSAILGHNYPCWLGFKGGKGIATTAGVVVGLRRCHLGFALELGLFFSRSAVTCRWRRSRRRLRCRSALRRCRARGATASGCCFGFFCFSV